MTIYRQQTFAGIDVVALDRHGGVSTGKFDSLNLAPYVGDERDRVLRNIEIAGSSVGAINIAYLRAEHGNTVHVVNDIVGLIELSPGDAAVTNQSEIALLALSADCVSGAIIDPVNRVIGVFHAGWKGVLARVAISTWETMQSLGATAQTSRAVLGPAICGSCYEVPADRVDEFREAEPGCIVDARHIDIGAGIRAQLERLQLPVEKMPGCTFEDQNLFSFRRANGEPTGRGGLIVCMQPELQA